MGELRRPAQSEAMARYRERGRSMTEREREEAKREVQTRWRRRRGMQPARRGRTHGTRSTYRVCTDGRGGGKCDDCKRVEREYRAIYRARGGP